MSLINRNLLDESPLYPVANIDCASIWVSFQEKPDGAKETEFTTLFKVGPNHFI